MGIQTTGCNAFIILFTTFICVIKLKSVDGVKLPSWLGANRMITGQPPSPRAVGRGMTALNDRFYLFGGFGPPGPLDTMFRFDPDGLIWTRLAADAATDSPSARWRHALAASGDHLYLFGGRISSGLTNELLRFDPG
eukprot:CAMPEP_0172207324 /NCGR_PEP_ID=MMETSP1050-20130122/33766_1 /TAXON_ID=233186 /ORGANISM="Cryptomonas curvata, Strain CCAP979/52" /LENGTH=136 /DNA_ID=CAMNT_0012886617 /DNA_START=99 /DNA_END=506 /DNA_ORIENTATION=-